MNKALASLSVLALAVALASPVAAQSISVKANIPFDFTVWTSALPAGDYAVSTLSTGVVSVRNESGTAVVLALSNAGTNGGARGQTVLVFHRYGDQYFLSQIWEGNKTSGRSIPMSRSEREVSNRASIHQPERVMILARL